jgi:WD40 repeat protein
MEHGPDTGGFYSAAGDGMIVRWSLDDPENGELLAKMKNSVYALHYRQDEKLIIAGQNFEGIHFIDPLSKTEIGSVKISNAQIFDIKSFENKIFVASADGTLYVVDMLTKAFIKRLSCPKAVSGPLPSIKVWATSLWVSATIPSGYLISTAWSPNTSFTPISFLYFHWHMTQFQTT